ncbi:MAG: helix-turn-helix domain-containing protein [Syntrophaceae bacterium]|nr:helix-turn-helix domain-containing protein [Syntrophaceae bacterium]
MRVVTAKEVGDYLRLNKNTVINLAGKGDLPGFKIGRSWRFDMNEIMMTIEKLKQKGACVDHNDGMPKHQVP